jgi:hypothetical protein
MIKMTSEAHHCSMLDGVRPSLIKQDRAYTENLPHLNLCIMLRSPKGNQYGEVSQIKVIGKLCNGYLTQE